MSARLAVAPSAAVVITGTGHAVPSRIVTNSELSASLGEDIHPFVSGTLGIHERRWCSAGESTASLAETAGRRAMKSAGIDASMIDLLVVATDTPEFISPATSSVVQGALGCVNAGTFDVNAGCAGFVTALDVAWKYLRADERYSRILIIGAYVMSRWLDQSDKKTVTIFADGAGAVVLERDANGHVANGHVANKDAANKHAANAHVAHTQAADSPDAEASDASYGVLASELYADGRLACDMGVFAGGAAEPIDEAVLRDGTRNRLRFIRKYPASVNEEGWPRIARSVLSRCGATPDDVSLWLWTQVNRSTITTVMRSLAQPVERAHTVMHKWGYTGSACLPMALDDAVSSGRLRNGDLVLVTGSGAGLAMGSLALRWRSPVRAQQASRARSDA